MCLILIGYKVFPDYPLVIAANRDEFYQRPTAGMHFWEKRPDILAGKDLKQNGTWFAVHRTRGFAALTNHRNPDAINQDAPSRGKIIIDYLESGEDGSAYLTSFEHRAARYNGFNLLAGDRENLFWFSNVKNRVETIEPGIHGLSNAFLNTAWPKVVSGKKALKKLLTGNLTPEALFSILADRSVPPDHLLPRTGIGLEWERRLSPLFIQSDIYGTRSSTVMIVDQTGRTEITERTYFPENPLEYEDRRFQLPGKT
ncbi:MAG: NRDE family protein [Desulfobacteraceae bacterium]